MKMLLLILLVFFSLQDTYTQVVRIEFFPGANEDYDVFLKRGMESIGYSAYINYFNRSSAKSYNLLLKYEWSSDTLSVSLYYKDGRLIKSVQRKLKEGDRLESQTYQTLSVLLDREVKVRNLRGKLSRATNLVGLQLVKLDSAAYILTVLGPETMSMFSVQGEFLRIASRLTGEFDSYFEGSYHQYVAGEKWSPESQCIGWKVTGIVLGTELSAKNYRQLSEPPAVYVSYLSSISSTYALPDGFPGDDGVSRLVVMRNSNRCADYGPYLLYLDGKQICNLNYGQFAAISVHPGWHFLTIRSFDPSSYRKKTVELQVNVPYGKDSFVSVIWSSHIGIIYQEVNAYEARTLLPGLSPSTCE